MSTGFFASMFASFQALNMPVGKSLNLTSTLADTTDFLTTSVVPTALGKSNNSDFSISFWLKNAMPSNSGGTASILTLGSQYQFYMFNQRAGFILNHTAGAGFQSNASTPSVPLANQWVHYTIVVVSGFVNIYVNGANVTTSQFKAGSYPTLSGLALSGADRLKIGVNSNYMKIQDLYFYSVALSSAQIAAVYNSGVGVDLSTVSQVSSLIDAGYSFNKTLSPTIGSYALLVNSGNTPIYSYDKS